MILYDVGGKSPNYDLRIVTCVALPQPWHHLYVNIFNMLIFSENVPGSGIPDEMPEVPPPVEGQILYPCAMHGVPEMQWR